MCLFTAAAVGTSMFATGSAAAAMAANVGMGLSIAQGAASYTAGRRQARASRRAYAASSASATSAAQRQFGYGRKQQAQEFEKMAEEIQNVSRERKIKQSTLSTSAMESGITGQSFNQLLDDFERQELEFQTNSERNFDIFSDNLEDQFHEVSIGTRDRIENLRSKVIAPPSFLATALQIGTGALNAYQNSGAIETRNISNQTNIFFGNE
tara:strand:- start:4843 stop:5472 length:630 start_codon:yes stop_codon:yes gene_type:complete